MPLQDLHGKPVPTKKSVAWKAGEHADLRLWVSRQGIIVGKGRYWTVFEGAGLIGDDGVGLVGWVERRRQRNSRVNAGLAGREGTNYGGAEWSEGWGC